MRASRLQFLLLFAVASAFLAREAGRYPLDAIEQRWVYWLSTTTAHPAGSAPVLLVEVDEPTLEQVRWPMSALDYSLFLQATLSMHPEVVAIFPVLEWPGFEGPDDEQHARILHDLILRTPRLLLGAKLGHRVDPDTIPPADRVPILQNVHGDVSAVPDYEIVSGKADESLSLSAAMGFVNLRSRGEYVQRAPLIFRYRGQVVPSFVLSAAMLWLKVTPDDVAVYPGEYIDIGGKMWVPIDASGQMLVDVGAPVARIGYDDLLLAVARRDMEENPKTDSDEMKGRLVLMGRTDGQSAVLKFPDGKPRSTVDFLAEAIATIQQGSFVRRVPWFVDAGLIVLFACLALVSLRWQVRRVLVTLLVMSLVYLSVSMGVFGSLRMWMPMVLPVGLAILTVLAAVIGRYGERNLDRPDTRP